MGKRFRQFLEAEAAPSPGGAAPSNPQTTKDTSRHFDSLKQWGKYDDKTLTQALEGSPLTIWKVPDYSAKWGFVVMGTCPAVVRELPDGNFELTFLFSEKQRFDRGAFYLPPQRGQEPVRYEGPIEDKTEIVSSEEIQRLTALPLAMGGQMPLPSPPGGQGGMGGMPGGM